MSNTLENVIQNDYSNKYVLVLDDRSFYPNYNESQESEIIEKRSLSLPAGYESESPSHIDPFRQSIARIWTYKSVTDEYAKQITFLTNFTDLAKGPKGVPSVYTETVQSPNTIVYENITSQWADFFEKGSYSQTLNLPRKATRVKIKLKKTDDLHNAAAAVNLITPMAIKTGLSPLIPMDQFGFQISKTNPEIFKDNSDSSIGYYGNLRYISPNYLEYATEIGAGPIKKLYQLDDSTKEFAESLWASWLKMLSQETISYNQFDSFYDPVSNDYSHDRLFYQSSEFSMDLPNSILAQENADEEGKSSLYVDIKSEYNYYSKLYEKSTTLDTYETSAGTQVELDEKQLPNIYDVPLSEDPDGTPDPSADLIADGTKYNFEKMGYKILNCEYFPSTSAVKNNSNIIVYQDNKQFLDKYDNVKTQFPFYVNLEFQTEPKKQFTSIFNNYGMTNKLISMIISNNLNADEQDGFVSTIDPDKSAPINGTRTYYNPLDVEPEYRIKDDSTAHICSEEIYKIVEKRHAYKLMPLSVYSEAAQTYAKDPIRLADPYLTREYDLNRWFDGYLKYLTTLTPSPITETSPGGINYEAWNQLVNGIGTAATYSKVYKDQDEELFGGEGDFFDIINASIFTGKYRSLVNEKARTYEDIVSVQGTEASAAGTISKDVTSTGAYNETLFYRIQKTPLNDDGTPEAKGIAQNIWIVRPNDEENSSQIMKYIDTQVKYNKNYEYVIYAYQLVVGTKYGFQFANKYRFEGDVTAPSEQVKERITKFNSGVENSVLKVGNYVGDTTTLYSSFEEFTTGAENKKYQLYKESLAYKSPNNQGVDNGSLMMFDVVCEPDVKLVEVPFYKKTVVVSDAPSTAPEVDIIPLRGEKNKIKINFYPSTVNQEMMPKIIEKGDDAKSFNKIRKSQGRDLFKPQYADKIEQFSLTSDDPSNLFPPQGFYLKSKLLFKTDDYPIAYQIYRMDSEPKDYKSFAGSKYTTIDATKKHSFRDKIETNKKYYYVFRSIDVHNNYSNPSPIYQVEMVENSGATYPIISIFNFDSSKEVTKEKSFKRYMKIDAQMLQSVINYEESGLLDDYGDPVKQLGPNNIDGAESISLGIHPEEKSVFSTNESEELPAELTPGPKRFLFRVKSKHTGKILDLRVAFKAKAVEGKQQQIVTCSTEGTQGTTEPEVS